MFPTTTEASGMSSNKKSSTDVKTEITTTGTSPTNPMVLELVFDRLLTNLSTDVSFQIHRMIKTGVFPSADLLRPKSRQELYPGIYQNEEEVKEELKRFGTDVPEVKKRAREGDEDDIQRYLRKNSATTGHRVPPQPTATSSEEAVASVANVLTASAMESSSTSPPLQPAVLSSASTVPVAQLPPPPQPTTTISNLQHVPASTNSVDIWGKIPPKEPSKMIECMICGRLTNSLRFAPHLDKCMGIGTTVRAAALAASGFVPQPAQSGVTSTTTSGGAAATGSAATTSSTKK